jgi:hypothetical protein
MRTVTMKIMGMRGVREVKEVKKVKKAKKEKKAKKARRNRMAVGDPEVIVIFQKKRIKYTFPLLIFAVVRC